MPHIVCSIMAVGVCAAAFLFFGAYDQYLASERRVNTLKGNMQQLTNQVQQLEQIRRINNQLQSFVNVAETLKLIPGMWTTYDVNLQEDISFQSAEQMINQCSNSNIAYFRPISLELKRIKKGENSQSKDKPKGDLQISVKGQFVVKQQ